MKNRPTAAIIIIGNEILSGRTIDQNIPFLTKRLTKLGIQVITAHVIGDVSEAIIQTVLECHKSYNYVFVTGGIGPTHDDITAEAIANAFNCPLKLHPIAAQILRQFYQDENLNDARLRMAYIPEGAHLIPNAISRAPGFSIKNVYVMAGVPAIMQAMFDGIAPTLIPGPTIYSKTIHCQLGESILANGLTLIQSQHKDVEIGSYPNFNQKAYLGLNLVLRGIDEASVLKATNRVSDLVKQQGGLPSLIEGE